MDLAIAALEAIALTLGALFTEFKHVDILRHQRYQADAVSDELVVKGTGVLLDLDKIESHRGDFRNDDPPQCICYSQVGVQQLELDDVARELEDLNLRLPREPICAEALPRLGLRQLLLIAERLALSTVARGSVDLHYFVIIEFNLLLLSCLTQLFLR